jgi:hypothetical protein
MLDDLFGGGKKSQKDRLNERKGKVSERKTKRAVARSDKLQKRGITAQYYTITVDKPYCAPPRSIIYEALTPYGIPIHGYSEEIEKVAASSLAERMGIEMKYMENIKFGPTPFTAMWLASAWRARITVSAKQAEWAEYLLQATGRLVVLKPISEKSKAAGKRRNGRMPAPWDKKEGKKYAKEHAAISTLPYDSNCSEGKKMWKDVNGALEKALAEQKKSKK